MVKMPRTVKRYSPAAGKHTEHTVERVKKRRASELKWGQRRFRRVTAGYRGFPRPKPSGEKPTRRVNPISEVLERLGIPASTVLAVHGDTIVPHTSRIESDLRLELIVVSSGG